MEEARKYVEPMEPQASEGDWLQLACNKHYFTDTCLGKSFLEKVIEGAHIPRPTPTSPGTASDGSGLEIVSPQKVYYRKSSFHEESVNCGQHGLDTKGYNFM